MLAGGGVWEGQTFLKNHEWCTETVVNGFDATLLTEIAFSAGFMKDPVDELGRKMRNHYGPSTLAFGHPGAGGSFAFADPEHDVAFAYVMNQMEYGVLPNGKSHRLVQALYGEIVGG
jgi:CubicO group peptidase (beta-lactamase class C family)